jgi:signal transduction histidine kinase
VSEVASTAAVDFTRPAVQRLGAGPRIDVFVARDRNRSQARVNRWFKWLLVSQSVAAVGIGVFSAGGSNQVATLAGAVAALLTLPTLILIHLYPHRSFTPFVVAFAQIGLSALLIQLTGGRTETYFHAFASLAFIALYRDWRVLPAAAGGILAFHALVINGAAATDSENTRALVELAAWLSFETLALIWFCMLSREEAIESSQRRDQHQQLLEQLEHRVAERTLALETEMQAREQTAQKLRENEQHHRNLVANLPIGIFETTRSGKVNFANPYLLSLIGLPPEFEPTAISLGDGRIFPIADRERLWARLESEREVRGFTATFRHFDGSGFDVVINAHLKETGSDGELVCEGTLEDVTSRKRAERDLDTLHSQLVIASRQAGMAEVASGVLHNVGNVLTSVNLIVHDVQDRLKTTRLSHLRRVVEILQREQPRLVEFLTEDGGGRQLPDFVAKLDDHLTSENAQLLTDVEGLVRHFEHIREIIVTQQGSAQLFGVLETLVPAQLFEDALRLNAESMDRHGISLERVFDAAGQVKADRHKVLQILVNLLKNAKDALQAVKPGSRMIRVSVTPSEDMVQLAVQDNGPGILPANLTRIFQHGFTTKPTGHGFGLHSSVLAAREMGGDLVATSPGLGHGATFILSLPRIRSTG